MTIKAEFFESTDRLDVTTDAGTYEISGAVDEAKYCLLLSSDKTVHVARNEVASADAGMRIPPNVIVQVSLYGSDQLSFVLGDGESDGSLWLTRTNAA